jgi:hypothetical protein
MKMTIYIPAIAIFVALIGASCVRETKIDSKAADIRTDVDPNEIFSLHRDGHLACIQIRADLPESQAVEILRNTTGMPRNRYVAAHLPPKTLQYEDNLPDANPYYYWVRLIHGRGNWTTFGPVRIGPDENKTGLYPDISDTYWWSVSRTYSSALISWNFPNVKYQRITIYRGTGPKRDRQTTIHSTLEWNSKIVDPLPDPEADYWYWTEALLGTGAIIYQGPINAEYASR